MPFLRRLSLQSKLILILLLVGLASMLVVSYTSYLTAKTAAQDAAQRQLAGVRITKTNLLLNVLAGFRDQLSSFAVSRTALESLVSFEQALRQMDKEPLDAAALAKLETFYRDIYLPGLEKTGGIRAELARVLPAEPGGRVLQSLYIANNPHPYEQGQKMMESADGSGYSAVHKRYHEIFRQVAARSGLEDLMLIEGASQRVVYSYQKTVEFGTSLATGPYSNTNLAAAVRTMLRAGDRNQAHMADFELYRPNLGKPAAFLCAPIFDKQAPAGVIVFQLPIDRFISILTANRGWQQEGLGRSGEVYLVGPDRLLRSRSRFMIEDPKGAIESFRRAEVPDKVLHQIERQQNVLMALPVVNESTRRALAGEAGVHEIRDYRNVSVVSAFGPIDFENVRWAVLAEMDSDEAYGPVAELGRKTLATAAGLSLLTSLLALAAATVVTRPVRALTAAARRVTAGDLDVHVEVETEDEIRELADAFNRMTLALRNKTSQLEQTVQRNEELLLNVLPAPAAAQFQADGGGQQQHTFADVSILYATINGLEEAPGGPTQSLEWLHQLVVAFDEAAERHQVEKLKTMGPNYLAVCGLSTPRPDHTQRAVDFAVEMLRIGALFGREKGCAVEIDVGLNAGAVTGGVVGRKKFIYDLWGESINLARMLKADGISSIQVTGTMADRLQGQYTLERQPDLERKGEPPIVVFRLHPAAGAAGGR